MIQAKRKNIALLVLFALFFTGCGDSSEVTNELSLAYTGSKSFEYFDVGNDRNADFLSGRGNEVCIPSMESGESSSEEEKEYVYGLYR